MGVEYVRSCEVGASSGGRVHLNWIYRRRNHAHSWQLVTPSFSYLRHEDVGPPLCAPSKASGVVGNSHRAQRTGFHPAARSSLLFFRCLRRHRFSSVLIFPTVDPTAASSSLVRSAPDRNRRATACTASCRLSISSRIFLPLDAEKVIGVTFSRPYAPMLQLSSVNTRKNAPRSCPDSLRVDERHAARPGAAAAGPGCLWRERKD